MSEQQENATPQPQNEALTQRQQESFSRMEMLQPGDITKSLSGLESLYSQSAEPHVTIIGPEETPGASVAGLENLLPPAPTPAPPADNGSQSNDGSGTGGQGQNQSGGE